MNSMIFIARQHEIHTQRDTVLPIPSVCLSARLSVQCRYCVKTNGRIVALFDALVGVSF